MGHVVVNWIQFCLLDELMCLTQWNEADQPTAARDPPSSSLHDHTDFEVKTDDSLRLFYWN